MWQANYGGSDDDEVNSVAATSDGGCVATGYTKSSNKNVVNNNGWVDIWVVKLKNDGSLDWSRAIGGGSYDNAYCIIPTLDTAYVLAGVTMSRSGDVQHPFAKKDSSSAWIIKLSEQGSIIWEKVYGGAKANGASWIVQTPRNHEYLFCGSTNSKNGDVKFNHGGTDAWVVKLERDTILQWEYTYGGSDYDNADCITIRKDNSYAFVGESKSSDGDLSGNIQSSYDGWVVILDGATAGIEAAANNDMGRLYPNPVINSLHLDLKGQNQRGAVMISDISGRELYNESVESKNINLDVSGFKSGVYLIRFQSNGMLWNGKFIKE